MTAATTHDPNDLDFTKLFSPDTKVAEPVASPSEQKVLSDEAVIGESKLASNGYFVRINDAAPRRQVKRNPPTIMVVEDDEVTATLLKRILVANGFKVTSAANRAAILTGLKNLPDLIILDVLMPDANGFDILKGLKLGANGYLTKPAKSKALLDAIKKVLGD